MVNCLEEGTIAAFVGGALDESALCRVDEHLAGCSDCRGVIAAAAYGAWGRTGTGSGTDGAAPTSDDLARAPAGGERGPVPALASGDVIAGKYEVEALLGAGGMGQVFAARHLDLRQRVAIKVLDHRGPTAAARFLREARTCANLASDHIPRVFDVGRLSEGAPYIVMDLLVGHDLRRLLKERGPIPAVDAVAYVLDACVALAAAHAAGIVHRDLKPANLFLTRRPDGRPLVKVLDFGISKITEELSEPAGDERSPPELGLTSTGAVLGSPLYMSPEQVRARRDVDARTDIWSLGAILFELVGGRPPFRAPTLPALAVAIAVEPPASLSSLRRELPSGLEAVVRRCLEKRPSSRFQSIDELARALRPFSREAGAQPAAPPPRHRRVVVALGLAVVGIIGWAAWRAPKSDAPARPPAPSSAIAGSRPAPSFASPPPSSPAAAPPASAASPSPPKPLPARPSARRRVNPPGPLDTPD